MNLLINSVRPFVIYRRVKICPRTKIVYAKESRYSHTQRCGGHLHRTQHQQGYGSEGETAAGNALRREARHARPGWQELERLSKCEGSATVVYQGNCWYETNQESNAFELSLFNSDLVECPLKDHSGHLSSSRSSVEKIYSILISVIRELQESLLTLKRGDDHPVLELPENDDEPVKFPPIRLGSRAPRLMRESDVSACMMCTRGNRSRGFRKGFSNQKS